MNKPDPDQIEVARELLLEALHQKRDRGVYLVDIAPFIGGNEAMYMLRSEGKLAIVDTIPAPEEGDSTVDRVAVRTDFVKDMVEKGIIVEAPADLRKAGITDYIIK